MWIRMKCWPDPDPARENGSHQDPFRCNSLSNHPFSEIIWISIVSKKEIYWNWSLVSTYIWQLDFNSTDVRHFTAWNASLNSVTSKRRPKRTFMSSKKNHHQKLLPKWSRTKSRVTFVPTQSVCQNLRAFSIFIYTWTCSYQCWLITTSTTILWKRDECLSQI